MTNSTKPNIFKSSSTISILFLSAAVSGLFFFVFINFSLAATKCGPEPTMRDCQILCPSAPGATENSPCYTDCGNKNSADSDAYIKCIDKEYSDYMQPTLDKWEREDQTKAAELARKDDDAVCNQNLATLAGKEVKCEDVCRDSYKSCDIDCGTQNPGYDSASGYDPAHACIVKVCEPAKKECVSPCETTYYNENKIGYAGCLATSVEKFNQKMDLINHNDWTGLQKIKDKEDKQAQEKNLADEKAKLDEAKANDPEITTISTIGTGVAVLQADGTWKTVYAETDIKDGDLIKTGSSGAAINYSDGSKIEVGPNTSLKYSSTKLLTELNSAKNDVEKKILLLVGKIRIWGKKLEVKTPNAVIADRGTEFIVDYNADINATKVYLYEGIVDVKNLKNETEEVQQGNTITIDGDGKMILGELNQAEWTQLSKEISTVPLQDIQQGTKNQGTSKSLTKTIIWLGLIGILCVIGAKVFIHRKKS